MNDNLQEQIKIVAEARANSQKLAEDKRVAYNNWLADNDGLLKSVEEANALVSAEEATLRELTLRAYEETGNKTPADGVSVKIFKTLNYDPKEALDWAVKHTIALTLDKKAFESTAKATPLDFVTTIEEPRAQIASDLPLDKED